MSHTLNAVFRTQKGRKTNELRAQGKIPAVVYGVGTEPRSIAIEHNALLKTYEQAGESTIVELKIDEKDPLHVLIQDLQSDPLLNRVSHVDFRSIDMNKEIEADVELEFVGEAPAVKTLGGTLVLSRDYVSVRCLPKDLIRTLKVDLSVLATFEDGIEIKDLDVPEGLVILDESTLSIAVVEAPRSEEEMAALDSAVEENVAGVEVAGKAPEEGVEDETTTEESAPSAT